MRIIWISAGLICLCLAIVGIVLPLLPTVPFLLLSAFFFAKSSDRLLIWLTTHPKLGPPIENWRSSGSISRRAKKLASLSIAAAFLISVALKVGLILLGIQAVVLVAVSAFIWTRPEE